MTFSFGDAAFHSICVYKEGRREEIEVVEEVDEEVRGVFLSVCVGATCRDIRFVWAEETCAVIRLIY